MVEAFRCSRCSAPVQDDRWTNCPYCGTVLNKPSIDPLRAVVAPERFAAAERAPSYAELMRREPSATSQMLGFGCQSVFLIAWMLGTFVMTMLFLRAGAGLFALVPAGMGILGIVLVARHSTRAVRFAQAPLERRVMVWRDERTVVSGGGKNSSSTTTHFVLLEGRDSRRIEVPCRGKLAGQHAPGDIGIAYLRGDVLLDFQRLEA